MSTKKKGGVTIDAPKEQEQEDKGVDQKTLEDLKKEIAELKAAQKPAAPAAKSGPSREEKDLAKWGKPQVAIITVQVDKGLLSMDVEYKPGLPSLNPHKVNYGVSGNQADAANMLGIVRKALFAKGYKIELPEGVEGFTEGEGVRR